MKKMKRSLCKIMAAAILFSFVFAAFPVYADAVGTIASAGGWNETLFAKLSGVTPEEVTGVSYSGPISGSLSEEDLAYLVRTEGSYTRIDILGLKAGSYDLTVSTTSGDLTKTGIYVGKQDRSGYAHFGYSAGVGAYKNNGELKENAIVLYVTNENKDTVSVTSSDGTTVVGIGNILNSAGMDTGSGTTSKGGIANTNQDILRKLAADGTPLVVRIVGTVKAPQGVTAYNSVDYGGSTGDNGFMVRMKDALNVTIEGVGVGAAIDGWGIHFMATNNYPQFGKSFEVRNLTFKNVPEDCVGMEGVQESNTLNAPVERCWIHHCSFKAPTVANPAESDKDGGDGACDFKRGQYFTNSYCIYDGYHKTNLVGASDSNMQYHITYHHNYWKNCESRGPLARQANIHMYNNIFEGQTSYCQNPRANAYIYSEYNLFYQSKNPVQVKSGGVVKSYQDVYTSCTGDMGANVVTDKSATVSSACKYANFDTNASLSYIPSGDYVLQTDIAEMKANVLALSGPQKATLVSPDKVNTSVIPADRYPTAAVVLPYEQNLNKTYVTEKICTVDNVLFNVAGLDTANLKLNGTTGCDIVFYVNTPANITVTDAGGSNPVTLCDENGISLLTGSGTVTNVPAGYYFIQSSVYDVGSGKYKDAKISGLAITAYDASAPTEPDPTAPSTEATEATEPTGETTATEATTPTTGGTTVVGEYTHNFDDGLPTAGSFFAASGSLSKSKGTVTVNSTTITQCLKVSSKASISFTAPADGTFTMVFHSKCAGYTLYVNGKPNSVAIPSDGILTLDVTAGTSYTITKNKSESFLYYMAYAPDVVEEPTEPSTEATEPSTEATEPSTEATEPSTEATEPSTEATEPSTEATEPSTEATEPSTEATEPSTEATEPSTEATEPSTEATEPSTEATEPSTEATEPSTEATEPSTEATEPSTEATEPSTEATEPSTEATKPSKPTDPENPKTMDAANPRMMAAFVAISLVSMCVMVVGKKYGVLQ